MTNKSIYIILKELEAGGQLVNYKSAVRDVDDPEIRNVWLTTELHAHLQMTGLNKAERDYRADIRAYLSDFVMGEDIDYGREMVRLTSPYKDLWEMKITLQPQTRLFGGFAYPDCFVCTYWSFRAALGKEGSKQWKKAEEKAHHVWTKLFPDNPRWPCWPLGQCITGGYDDDF